MLVPGFGCKYFSARFNIFFTALGNSDTAITDSLSPSENLEPPSIACRVAHEDKMINTTAEIVTEIAINVLKYVFNKDFAA